MSLVIGGRPIQATTTTTSLRQHQDRGQVSLTIIEAHYYVV